MVRLRIAAALIACPLAMLSLASLGACSASPTTPAAALTVRGGDLFEAVGEFLQLTATLTQDGTSTDVTTTATWSSSAPHIADWTSPGRIRAFLPGSAVITAKYDGAEATWRLFVPRAEDCIAYVPETMEVSEETFAGTQVWALRSPFAGAYVYHTAFFDAGDAADGLALARHHRRSCFAGRFYGGNDRQTFIVAYWTGGSGPLPAFNRTDCQAYDRSRLSIAADGPGWTVFDGPTRVAQLYYDQDAARILSVARQHDSRCYIGRGRTYPDPLETYATSFFR